MNNLLTFGNLIPSFPDYFLKTCDVFPSLYFPCEEGCMTKKGWQHSKKLFWIRQWSKERETRESGKGDEDNGQRKKKVGIGGRR